MSEAIGTISREATNVDVKKDLLNYLKSYPQGRIEIATWNYIEDAESLDTGVILWDEEDNMVYDKTLLSMHIPSDTDWEIAYNEYYPTLLKEAKKIKRYLSQHFKNVVLVEKIIVI